jgi:predicted carbohydrate-binding protein with CBM5 and CBM33 domain
MMVWKKKLTKITSLAVCGILGSLLFTNEASAHGYIDNSRAALCKQKVNTSCGPVQYEPQSVEALGNFPLLGPADGQLAGGGIFHDLDVQTSTRWHKVNMTNGKNTFSWTFTANHRTKEWKYYITKKGWNPNKALTRGDLELITTVSGENKQPAFNVSHVVDIPTDRTGYHVILGVWEIADTPNAFYQVVDVNLRNTGALTGDTKVPSSFTNVLSTQHISNSFNFIK